LTHSTSDGTDYSHRVFLFAGTYVYESLDDKAFYSNSNPGNNRDINAGWLIYQNTGGVLGVTPVSYLELQQDGSNFPRDYELTIPEMLNKMK